MELKINKNNDKLAIICIVREHRIEVMCSKCIHSRGFSKTAILMFFSRDIDDSNHEPSCHPFKFPEILLLEIFQEKYF